MPRKKQGKGIREAFEVGKELITKGNVDAVLSKMPRAISGLIKRYPNQTIIEVEIIRNPVVPISQFALDNLTSVRQKMKERGTETLYHAVLNITLSDATNLTIEKNQRVYHKKGHAKIKKGGDSMKLKPKYKKTLADVFSDIVGRIGAKNTWQYSGSKSNCQTFAANFLKSLGVYSSRVAKFISQDARALFNKKDAKLADRVTDLMGSVSYVIEGGGKKKGNGWIAHVKAVQKKEGISYREALKIASKTYTR